MTALTLLPFECSLWCLLLHTSTWRGRGKAHADLTRILLKSMLLQVSMAKEKSKNVARLPKIPKVKPSAVQTAPSTAHCPLYTFCQIENDALFFPHAYRTFISSLSQVVLNIFIYWIDSTMEREFPNFKNGQQLVCRNNFNVTFKK